MQPSSICCTGGGEIDTSAKDVNADASVKYEWKFTSAVDGNTTTYVLNAYSSGSDIADHTITASYNSSDGTLVLTGTGSMPDLNTSTETLKGQFEYALPWAGVAADIKSVSIGDGITSVGAETFRGYNSLQSVSIGKDVARLGTGCVSNNPGLTSITVNAANTHFTVADGCLLSADGHDLIAVCKDKEELVVPATVKRLLFESVRGCAAISSLTWADGAAPEFVGYCAFGELKGLAGKTLELPATISHYGPIPFIGCDATMAVNCHSTGVAMALVPQMDRRYVLTIDGKDVTAMLHPETVGGITLQFLCADGKAVVYSQEGTPQSESLTIPNTVTVDGIEYKVTAIGGNVFRDYQKSATADDVLLRKISLGDNITRIGAYAFANMSHIESITAAAQSLSVDFSAFYNDKLLCLDASKASTLEFVHLSNANLQNVKSLIIKDEDMLSQALLGLRQGSTYNTVTVIYVGSKDGPTLQLNDQGDFVIVMTGAYTDAQGITYSLHSVNGTNYAEATSLSPLTAGVTFPASIRLSLGGNEVTVPVTAVAPDFVVSGNTGIVTALTFNAEGLTYGADFSGLQNLQTVTINARTTFKKEGAFAGLASLSQINVNAYADFSRDCFKGCPSLTVLDMPFGGKTNGSFTDCLNISKMSFGGDECTVAPYITTQQGEPNLKSVTIAGGDITIQSGAFYKVKDADVTIGGISHLTLGNYSFTTLTSEKVFDLTHVGQLTLSDVGFSGTSDATNAYIFSNKGHKIIIPSESMYLQMLKGAYWRKTANPFSGKYVTAFSPNNIVLMANGGTYDPASGKVTVTKYGQRYEAEWHEAEYDTESAAWKVGPAVADRFTAGKTYYAVYDMSSVSLTDGEPYTNTETATGVSVSYTRDFPEAAVGHWVSLYVPFDIEVTDELLRDFDFAKLYMVSYKDADGNGEIDADEPLVMLVNKFAAGRTLHANKPYFIRVKSAGTKTITVTGATLMPAASGTVDCSTTEDSYVLTGCYEPTSLTGRFAMLNSGQFGYFDNGTTLSPYRWYMTVSGRTATGGDMESYAKKISVLAFGEDDTTGITGIKATEKPVKAGGVYTVDGRKADASHLAPGIYIMNGRKVVVTK